MNSDDVNQVFPQQHPAPTGSLQKEQESMPSGGADFSELKLPVEQNVEQEPQVSKNVQTGMPPASHHTQAGHIHAASQQVQSSPKQSSHMQHVMTKIQAQQIVKGQLIFKNSSDPLLWLAFLILRHYQLLEKEEQDNNQISK